MHYILQPYNYNLSDPESIPNLFLKHLSLVGIIMLISLIIAIPVGLLVARYRRLYLPVVGISDVLYTIPSIAAFALLIPITGLTPATAIIPMVLFNQLILIRNTVAAVNGIDPLLIEVGRAMGMKSQQVLSFLGIDTHTTIGSQRLTPRSARRGRHTYCSTSSCGTFAEAARPS